MKPVVGHMYFDGWFVPSPVGSAKALRPLARLRYRSLQYVKDFCWQLW